MHVEQVLGNVPPTQRCQCRAERPKDSGPPTPSGALGWLKARLGK